jgi:hypothetical protein
VVRLMLVAGAREWGEGGPAVDAVREDAVGSAQAVLYHQLLFGFWNR